MRLVSLAVLLVGLAVVASQRDPDTPSAIPPHAGGQLPEGSIGLLPGEHLPLRILLASELAGDSHDWGVERVKAPEAWKVTKGKGIVVAVLDTGCDLTHADLKAGIAGSKDFTGSPAGASDVQGHGTHCCGVVGARLDLQGQVGVAPECSLLVVKVLGDQGWGSDTGISAGIDWAVSQQASVISMSLGSSGPSAGIHAACKRAVAKGVIVVAAAGNSGPREGTVGYPGGHPECIAVAATDINDQVAGFSSRGPAVFIASPGVNIRSTYPGGRYAEMSGTSMATPHVAGLAALWVAAHQAVPQLERPAAFKAALMKVARDLGPVGRDTSSGYGFAFAPGLVEGGPVLPPPPGDVFVITQDDLAPISRKRWEEAYPLGKFRLELPAIRPDGAPGIPSFGKDRGK